MKISKKLLIIAVIIGLGTVFLLNQYMTGRDGTAAARVPQEEVLVATATIPVNTRITSDMLEVGSISADAVHPEAVKNAEDAVGTITRSEVVRGEQVLASRLATEDGRASLSYRVPEGMRAISIPVSEVSGVAGYISSGDMIDVLVTYTDGEIDEGVTTTYTVFQGLKVLATGELTQERDDEESYLVSTITLAAEPAQAEVLAYATLGGSFHLTLRSPADEETVDLDSYSTSNFDTFRRR